MVEVPVFIVNGLLDSGKTTTIKEIIESDADSQVGNTLLIVCEEGEVEYDDEFLAKYNLDLAYVDNGDLTADKLLDLDEEFSPKRIIIELNGFCDMDSLEFPQYMRVYQQVTIIDASNFKYYFPNMKQQFNNLVKYSSLIIFNRCDGIKELGSYRRQIRAFNKDCQIGFQTGNGQITATLDEDLPYDISKDVIILEETDYPTWYVDVFDNYEKYQNKTIKFKTFVKDILENTFVIGRDVMTCCEDDIQFLGYEVINDTDVIVGIGDCIFIECYIAHEYSELACEEVVMLHATKISKLPNEENKVLSF